MRYKRRVRESLAFIYTLGMYVSIEFFSYTRTRFKLLSGQTAYDLNARAWYFVNNFRSVESKSPAHNRTRTAIYDFVALQIIRSISSAYRVSPAAARRHRVTTASENIPRRRSSSCGRTYTPLGRRAEENTRA